MFILHGCYSQHALKDKAVLRLAHCTWALWNSQQLQCEMECSHFKYVVCRFKWGIPVCSEKSVLLVSILQHVGYRKDLELPTYILTN